MKYDVRSGARVVGVIDGIKLTTDDKKLRQLWTDFENNGVTIFGNVGKMPEDVLGDGLINRALSEDSLGAAMLELELNGYAFSDGE